MTAATQTQALASRTLSSDDLLRAGRSLKVLAILVILTLSVGVLVLSVERWVESGLTAEMFRTNGDVIYGFGLLMLLTVGYLVGKGWATTRYQRMLISQLLEEESITRARRLDPVMDYHHPELCREILLRQANYAARIRSPLSLVELTVPEFARFSAEEQNRPLAEEFYQELRRHCRPLDFWVRWTPNSFLLVLLDISSEETAGLVYRIRSKMERWWEQQAGIGFSPKFEWRYRAVGGLGSSGDILREVHSLMDPSQFVPTPIAGVWQAKIAPNTAAGPKNRKEGGEGK